MSDRVWYSGNMASTLQRGHVWMGPLPVQSGVVEQADNWRICQGNRGISQEQGDNYNKKGTYDSLGHTVHQI